MFEFIKKLFRKESVEPMPMITDMTEYHENCAGKNCTLASLDIPTASKEFEFFDKNYTGRWVYELGHKYGWTLTQLNEKTCVMIFHKKHLTEKYTMKLNVYYTKMTVGVILMHPKVKYVTQKFVKNVDKRIMEKIFKNPKVN